MLHRRHLLLLSAFLAFAPASAYAASATQDGYGDGGVVEETDEGGNTPSATDAPSAAATPSATATSDLPFTGMEAGLIAAAGFGLFGTGMALRRVGREQE